MVSAQFPAGYAVLGALLLGPAHGYELHQRLHRGLGPIWHIAQSQLYSTLQRLQSQGLLNVEIVSQRNRPPRKVYALTPAGEAAFWEWALAPVRHVRDLRVEFLAKLYFLRRHSPERIPLLLEQQAQVLTRLQERLSHRKALPSDDPLLGELALKFRLAQVGSVLSWLDECRTQASKKEEP
jgi:DNA-binding PadR family transcriptional regulator